MDRYRVHLRGVMGIVDPFENATRRVILRCLSGSAGISDHDFKWDLGVLVSDVLVMSLSCELTRPLRPHWHDGSRALDHAGPDHVGPACNVIVLNTINPGTNEGSSESRGEAQCTYELLSTVCLPKHLESCTTSLRPSPPRVAALQSADRWGHRPTSQVHRLWHE
jgi:hypothetical protein